eukprot:352869-Chlamydomonas_euryale.AAC.12
MKDWSLNGPTCSPVTKRDKSRGWIPKSAAETGRSHSFAMPFGKNSMTLKPRGPRCRLRISDKVTLACIGRRVGTFFGLCRPCPDGPGFSATTTPACCCVGTLVLFDGPAVEGPPAASRPPAAARDAVAGRVAMSSSSVSARLLLTASACSSPLLPCPRSPNRKHELRRRRCAAEAGHGCAHSGRGAWPRGALRGGPASRMPSSTQHGEPQPIEPLVREGRHWERWNPQLRPGQEPTMPSTPATPRRDPARHRRRRQRRRRVPETRPSPTLGRRRRQRPVKNRGAHQGP